MADVIKTVAPIAGSLLGGPVGGALGGLAGGLADNAFGKGHGVGNIAGNTALGAGEGLVGGMKIPGQTSTIGSQLGSKLGSTFAPNGQLDFSKIAGAGGALANMYGANQQRHSAQDYANANIAQRNALMSKILAPQSYGTPNTNAQGSATPGIGSGAGMNL